MTKKDLQSFYKIIPSAPIYTLAPSKHLENNNIKKGKIRKKKIKKTRGKIRRKAWGR
jgi:hypothetical protein